VPEGTAIFWFNGDVDHDRKITLTRQDDVSGSDGSSNLYLSIIGLVTLITTFMTPYVLRLGSGIKLSRSS
jgi:hypothetical protein